MINNKDNKPKQPSKPERTDLGVQVPRSVNPKPPKTKGGK